MTCYNCNREIVDGSRYCYHCGAAQKVAPPPPPPPARPLRRSRQDKVIGGVCGGFARHFELDVSLVRIVWVLVALFGGGGIIAYIICWIIIPMEPEPLSTSSAPTAPASQ